LAAEIYISLGEIHKWASEIGISAKEIPISLEEIGKSKPDSCWVFRRIGRGWALLCALMRAASYWALDGIQIFD